MMSSVINYLITPLGSLKNFMRTELNFYFDYLDKSKYLTVFMNVLMESFSEQFNSYNIF